MRPAVFISGDGVANVQKLVAVGLADMMGNAAGIPTPSGPDGNPGIVFSWPTNNPRSYIAYLPDSQTWFPAAERDGLPEGRFWIGLTNDSPVSPDDLFIGEYPGVYAKLGDGNRWLIPSAGHFPHDVVVEDNFHSSYVLQPHLVELFEEAIHWTKWLNELDVEAGSFRVNSQVVTFLHRMLMLNYREFPDLYERLDLFRPQFILQALMAATVGIVTSDETTTEEEAVQ